MCGRPAAGGRRAPGRRGWSVGRPVEGGRPPAARGRLESWRAGPIAYNGRILLVENGKVPLARSKQAGSKMAKCGRAARRQAVGAGRQAR